MPTTEELSATIESALALADVDGATIERNPHSTIVPSSMRIDTASRRALEVMSDLAAADRTNKLELSGTLGEGGMGIVRLGRQTSLDRQVAVKTLKKEHRDERETLKLLREAWVTGGLEHPNVVPVYDIALGDEGEPLIVLKKIEGVDWASLMHDKAAIHHRFGAEDPMEWNLRILLQVCNAVRFAHSRHILHRDLKPENVMIGSFGEVYLVDWGIAVALDDDGTGRLPLASEQREMAGTPCYMAPEMLGGKESRLSARTDIYLMGAILYEIVAGRAPHEGDSLMAIVSQIVESAPPMPEDTPPELERIVRRAMDPDPDARFENAEQLRLALQAFLEHRDAMILADRAQDRLSELLVFFDQSPKGKHQPEDREPIYHLFGECRFGFRHALEVWPENEAAHAGLERATRTMVEYELAQGEPEAARALLTELTSPAMELAARVEAARMKKREEEQELRKLQEDLDPSRGRRTRWGLAIMLGSLWTLLPLGTQVIVSIYGYEPNHLNATVVALGLLAVLSGLGIWARDSMTRTAINRRLGVTAILSVVLSVVLQLSDWIQDVPWVDTMRHELLVWSCLSAMLVMAVDRRLMGATLGYLVGFIVATWQPSWVLYVVGATNLILTINTAIIWSSPRDMEIAKEEWLKRRAARRRWIEERFARDRRAS